MKAKSSRSPPPQTNKTRYDTNLAGAAASSFGGN
jgi:hypothetical protein